MPKPEPAAGAAAPAAEAAEEPAEEHPLAPMEEELLRDTRVHREWRVSYSKLDDDIEQTRKFYSYLASQMRHLTSALVKQSETKRRLNDDEMKAAHGLREANRGSKRRKYSEYYRLKRH